jgi:hypothetical protein
MGSRRLCYVKLSQTLDGAIALSDPTKLLTLQNYLREDATSAIALALIYLFPTRIFFLLQLGF